MSLRNIFTLALLSYISVIQANNGISKHPMFENFNNPDEFHKPYIRTIFQDNKGYIWLGSSEGLTRFDGKDFTIIRQNGEGNETLSDNYIYSICEDTVENTLWVGTLFGGINKINLETLKVTNFLKNSSDETASQIDANQSIFKINRDLMLIGTKENGLFKFIPSSNHYYKIKSIYLPDNGSYKVNQIKAINGEVWAATSIGLIRMDLSGQVTELVNGSINPKRKTKENEIIAFEQDRKGNIYFITKLEIWKYAKNRTFTLIAEPKIENNQLTALALDDEDNIWYGTNGFGIQFLNLNTGITTSYYSDSTEKANLQDNAIQSLTLSKKQPILWVGTKTGFSKLDLTKGKFNYTDISNTSGSAELFVIFEDSEKSIWFWTPDGLYRKRIDKESYQHMNIPIPHIESINCMVEDQNKTLWLSTTCGLYSYDMQREEFRHFEFEIENVNKYNLNVLSSMKRYDKDRFLIATYMGVLTFNTKTLEYKLFKLPKSLFPKEHYQFTDFILSSDSIIWLGSNKGILVKFDPKTEKYSFYDSKQKSTNFEKSNFILGLNEDNKKNIWLTTYGDGLLKFDTKNSTFTRKHNVEELSSCTYAIIKDTLGNFWISTNFGICHLNPETDKTEIFGKSDGTFCSEFNEGAYFTAQNGEIYFGGTNGFIHFNPYKLTANPYIPPVYISSVLYGGENVTPQTNESFSKEPSIVKEITVQQAKKNLVIYVSVLNYSGSISNKIAWKLKGYDNDWNYGRANEKIVYSNLPHGNYTLLTKGSNNNNIWNNNGESIEINIDAPFYMTPQAWLLFALFIILGVSIIVYYRYNWQRKQKVKLELLVKAKTHDLEKANEELELNKIEILSQKGELEIHRNYLEETVERRTADLQKARTKAEESDKLKTAFLANLSHEIRTPMNAIIGFSSLLNTNMFSLKEQKEFISLIMASSETLLVLIDDILDISRIETAQITITPSTVKVGSFLNQLFQTLTFENNNQATEFYLEIDKELANIEIQTDPTRLKQIVTNLAGNALKFTKKGFVKITAKKEYYALLKNKGFIFKNPIDSDQEILFISVEDTGLGIEQENLEVIFEPFRKIESPNNELFGGVGLGLSIVKKLVLLLGGEIEVKSVINEGSLFYFYLPLTDAKYGDDLESEDENFEDDWM